MLGLALLPIADPMPRILKTSGR